jgi:hypothetical protein
MLFRLFESAPLNAVGVAENLETDGRDLFEYVVFIFA